MRGGFTLVELVVVIAIIAILLGLLLPVLFQVRHVRQRVQCLSNLHQIGVGLGSYGVDFFDALPTHHHGSLAIDTVGMFTSDGQAINLGLIERYASDGRLFYCPTQTAEVSPDLAYDSPANPWQPPEGQSSSPGEPSMPTSNSSYAARPSDGSDSVTPRWRLSNYSSQTIYTDFVGVDGWSGPGRFTGTLNAAHEGRGYSRLFGDGATRWVDASPLNELRPINATMPDASQLQAYYERMDVLP